MKSIVLRGSPSFPLSGDPHITSEAHMRCAANFTTQLISGAISRVPWQVVWDIFSVRIRKWTPVFYQVDNARPIILWAFKLVCQVIDGAVKISHTLFNIFIHGLYVYNGCMCSRKSKLSKQGIWDILPAIYVGLDGNFWEFCSEPGFSNKTTLQGRRFQKPPSVTLHI